MIPLAIGEFLTGHMDRYSLKLSWRISYTKPVQVQCIRSICPQNVLQKVREMRWEFDCFSYEYFRWGKLTRVL